MNRWWEVRQAEGDSSVGELYLYDPIASDGSLWALFFDDITPKQIKRELDALGDIRRLNVFINSPGGEVFASNAIHNLIRRHKAETWVYIDGLAASGASIVAVAGDHVIAYPNSMGMLHNAWTWAMGEAKDFRKEADTLDEIQKSIIGAYSVKMGLPKDEIARLMNEETWMDSERMLELGFVDEIDTSKEIDVRCEDHALVVNGRSFDVRAYPYLKNAPAWERRNTSLDLPERRSPESDSSYPLTFDLRDALRAALDRAEEREEEKVERRQVAGVEVRVVPGENGAPARIEGHAAVFDKWSVVMFDPVRRVRFKEKIHPGAFKDAIESDDVRCLWNHDRNLVLGRTKNPKGSTLELREDGTGLFFSASPPDWSGWIQETIDRGDVDGGSFGFAVTDPDGEKWNFKAEIAEREIFSARLYDVSPATYPAYQTTEVSARSDPGHDDTIPAEEDDAVNDLSLLERELELALLE
ncbi:MAG: HK97 family phage prohead protease [Deltaproteobacteria bacterium]|nr:HK97 family phage prohead protease [Deltaproteobacteria bacterium]